MAIVTSIISGSGGRLVISGSTDGIQDADGVIFLSGSMTAEKSATFKSDVTATDGLSAFSTVTVNSSFQLDNDEIKDSGGAVAITFDGSQNAQLAGTLRVDGDSIEDSGGSAAISFDGSQNTQLAGGLQIDGDYIHDSGGSAGITFDSNGNTTVDLNLKLGNDTISDSGDNTIIQSDGSGAITVGGVNQLVTTSDNLKITGNELLDSGDNVAIEFDGGGATIVNGELTADAGVIVDDITINANSIAASAALGISSTSGLTIQHGPASEVQVLGGNAVFDIKTSQATANAPKIKFSRQALPAWNIVGSSDNGLGDLDLMTISFDDAYGSANNEGLLFVSGSGQSQFGEGAHNGIIQLAGTGQIKDAKGVTKLSVNAEDETVIGAGAMSNTLSILPDGSRETMYGWNTTTCKRINKYNELSTGSFGGGNFNHTWIQIAAFQFSSDMNTWNRTFQQSYNVTMTGPSSAWRPFAGTFDAALALRPFFEDDDGLKGWAKGAQAIPNTMESPVYVGIPGAGAGPSPKDWTGGPHDGTHGSLKAWPWFQDPAWGQGGVWPAPTGGAAYPTGIETGIYYTWQTVSHGTSGAPPYDQGFLPLDSGILSTGTEAPGRPVAKKLDFGYPGIGGGPPCFELRYRVDVIFTPRATIFHHKEIPKGSGLYFDEFVPLPPEVSIKVKLLSDPDLAPNIDTGAFKTFTANNFAALNFSDPAIPASHIDINRTNWGNTSFNRHSPWQYDAGTGVGQDPLKLAIFVNAGVAGANCYVEAIDSANQADMANTSEGQGQFQLAPIRCVQGGQSWMTADEVQHPVGEVDPTNPQGVMRYKQAGPANEWQEGDFRVGGLNAKDASVYLSTTDFRANGVVGVHLEAISEINLISKAASPTTLYRLGKVVAGPTLTFPPPNTGASNPPLSYDTTTGLIGVYTSTRKLKDNITNSNIGLSEILSLNPVTYKFKTSPGQELGLIAEEVADVSSLFAVYGHDKTYDEHGHPVYSKNEDGDDIPVMDSDELVPIDLNTRGIIAALINSVQELKEENDQLKLRIEALETE